MSEIQPREKMHLQNHLSSAWLSLVSFSVGMESGTPPLTSSLISYFVTYFAWRLQLYSDDSASVARITWIVKTKCRNTWEWNGSCCCCLVPLTSCACQSKSIAVFCWFLSAVNVSVLKAFGNHTYNVISVESRDTPCRFPHWVENFVLHLLF